MKDKIVGLLTKYKTEGMISYDITDSKVFGYDAFFVEIKYKHRYNNVVECIIIDSDKDNIHDLLHFERKLKKEKED